jgi:hypothetical protein
MVTLVNRPSSIMVHASLVCSISCQNAIVHPNIKRIFPHVSLPSNTFQPTCHIHKNSRRLWWWKKLHALLLMKAVVDSGKETWGEKYVVF